MIYKDFKGLKLSALGLGCMRLPVIDGKDGQIDEEATAKMVASCDSVGQDSSSMSSDQVWAQSWC